VTPSFSIVIVAYGKRQVTEECLETLEHSFGQRLGRDVELVLVDNASPDDTAHLFAAWADRATVLALPENRNFAGGYNAGALAATGDVLVLLNNDTLVRPGALDQLADAAREPSVGLAGCRLIYPDGTLQHGGFGWRTVEGQLVPFHLFHHEPDSAAAATIQDLDSVTGACVAIRRELFVSSGGFDEGFVNGWEDVDLCLRLRSAGLRVVYRGDIAIVHAEGQTSGGQYGAGDNVERFARRWLHHLRDDTERVRELFDATWAPPTDPIHGPARHPRGTTTVAVGPVTGLDPDGAEGRAILAAMEAAGMSPAARDLAPVWLRPRLEEAAADALDRAVDRACAPRAAKVLIGDDPRGVSGIPTVIRVAGRPSSGITARTAILAADAASAAEALLGGADPDLVRIVPPPVAPVPLGAGGGGLLVIAPAHDLDRCRALAAALGGLGGVRITIVPTAASATIAEIAQELGATCAPPVSDETRFAELAGGFDAVLCADAADRFQRRALVAAAAGATPILLAGGPA
jgi:GT2 family glycosyltransferase